MSDTIFFSWQSDCPAKTNKNFIEDALKKAIRDLGKSDDELVEAPRPVKLDKDTCGVPGSPSIADTIFQKIVECAVFVPDLTFVAKTGKDRPVANPNVLIEYGWGLSHVGDERIVAVMNSAFGEPDKDTMPFNIVHKRWPIRYHLEEGATAAERKKIKVDLVRELKGALFAALEVMPDKPKPDLPSLTHKSKKTCFLDNGDLLGKLLPFGEADKGQNIHWADGPQVFLRVIPENSEVKYERTQLYDLAQSQKLPLLNPRIISSWDLVNEFGFVVFESIGEEDQSSTQSFVQLTTWGEIWAVDAKTLRYTEGSLLFPEVHFASKLSSYLDFMRQQLSLTGSVTIQAGYSGIIGMPAFRPPLMPKQRYGDYGQKSGAAVVDEFVTTINGVSLDPNTGHELVINREVFAFPEFTPEQEDEETKFKHAYKALIPFYDEFWDNLGIPRFDFLPT